MSGRRAQILASNEIYHIFNRSVAKEEILIDKRVLKRAASLLDFYRYPQKLRFSYFRRLSEIQKSEYLKSMESVKPIVEIYAYSFMPTHYHILAMQIGDDGIEKFTSNFQNSFAKYFNIFTKRAGSVFQKPFKAKHISSDMELLHVSRYIHLNPVTALLITIDELESYPWTSYRDYLNEKQTSLIKKDRILDLSGTLKRYMDFVKDQVDYQRKLHLIKSAMID